MMILQPTIQGSERIKNASFLVERMVQYNQNCFDFSGVENLDLYFPMMSVSDSLKGVRNTVLTERFVLPNATSISSHLYYLDKITDYEIVDDGYDVLIDTARNFCVSTPKLVNVKLPKNRIAMPATNQNFIFTGSNILSDESISSIANSAHEGTLGRFEFNASIKSRLSSIMGTVALDPTGTYHVFTLDPTGTVSVQDFITTTKGWEIA